MEPNSRIEGGFHSSRSRKRIKVSYDSDDVSSDEANNTINCCRAETDCCYSDDDSISLPSSNYHGNHDNNLEDPNSSTDNLNENNNQNNDFVELPNEDECESFFSQNEEILNNIGERAVIEERNLLFDGCKLTKEEGDLLILNYSVRWNLPDAGLEDLLKLINSFLPFPALTSKYHLLKKFKSSQEYEVIYMCPDCKLMLTIVNDFEYKCNFCQKNHSVIDLKEKKNYFLHMSLRQQLEEFLKNKQDLISKAKNMEGQFSNILSGKYYKKLRESNIINGNDLILQMNTDGVKLFKSSSLSLWPVQFEIANLLYKDKREHTLLTDLWYGNDKPNINTFLKPTIEELKYLHDNGITIFLNSEEITIKVHTIICSVDSVARCAMQNMKQYNGEYGCTFCYHKGVTVPVGRGHTSVYPYMPAPLRKLKDHIEHVQAAEREKKIIFGVKGYSICLEIPLFNMIDSFVGDYMHCVLLGVVKTYIDSTLSSTSNGEDFYIGNRIKEIQHRLNNIKPPSEITRTPGNLIHRKNFKASEWKTFLCYYLIPVFKNILPRKYLNHWLLLVAGIRILLQPKINRNERTRAKKFLKEFVSQVGSLYNIEFYKYNTHLLLHLQKTVDLFGSLWDTSCFTFEHYNGVLAKMFKNSQSVPEQICKSYNRFKRIEKASVITFSNPECPDNVKLLYNSLTSHLRLSHLCIEEGVDLRVLGAGVKKNLDIFEKVALQNLLRHPTDESADFFYRFIYKNVVWHGNDQNLLEKRCNSFARLIDGSIVLIKCIVSVKNIKNEKKIVILANKCKEEEKMEEMATYSKLKLVASEIYKCCTVSKDIVAFNPQKIDKKCVAVPYGQLICISTLVNDIERD